MSGLEMIYKKNSRHTLEDAAVEIWNGLSQDLCDFIDGRLVSIVCYAWITAYKCKDIPGSLKENHSSVTPE